MNKKKIKTRMTNNGMIAYYAEKAITVRFNKDETEKMLKKKIDFTKYDEFCEVTHLEISNNCNMNCPYCYTGEKKGEELSVNQWKQIIDTLVDYGVFQITFGGGEPTLYNGLLELAMYANTRGLNVGMTTNGKILDQIAGKWLKSLFKQVNISWHQNGKDLIDPIEHLFDNNVPIGINYCYSKDMSTDNEEVKELAKHYDAELLYLAYKPVIGDFDNVIQPVDIYKIAEEASDEGIRVAVDGPCAGLCMMKKKFCDIDHAGEAFPCSFVRETMGNVLEKDFKSIWSERGKQVKCPYVEIAKEV